MKNYVMVNGIRVATDNAADVKADMGQTLRESCGTAVAQLRLAETHDEYKHPFEAYRAEKARIAKAKAEWAEAHPEVIAARKAVADRNRKAALVLAKAMLR